MVQTYKPRIMDVTEETLPELQPIFSFLNSHSNKLYHEGYFLKLDDQNSQGKPNPDRTWVECFAQLVGTVLSLWDAAELDAAGEDGKVMPKFLNLTDASIKMIESLPTRSSDEQPLQNILSISTAGRNRYLLHFNSHESLVQWTAAVRLAIYEYNCLQEAYTGALIAGKGKTLNNINVIMERARFKTEEWVLVRFGAGVPWRRCWGVINPPNEKEYAKLEKELKKRSPYDRSTVPVVKGDIKFYDQKIEGKKQKKVQPIATITDAYSAYAIYPQSKNLIDPSTLLKIEGNITIHSEPPSSSEGFVFIMPEIRPMVSGFEMLLRFLFPTWDTFGLYGRPGKIVASILDARSLMFAMPKHRRYGYLEPVDVINLIADHSSGTWNEQEWRRRMKEATGSRMNAIEDGSRRPPSHSRSDSRNSNQVSIGDSGSRPQVGFADDQRDRSGSLNNGAPQDLGAMRSLNTPEPVSRPPAEFGQQKSLGQRASKAYHSPELRRANSRLSRSTLAHLVKAGGMDPNQQPIESLPEGRGMEDGAIAGPSVHSHANPMGAPANDNRSREALRPPGQGQGRPPGSVPPPLNLPQRSESPMGMPFGPPSPYGAGPNQPRPQNDGSRSPYPPGGPAGGPMGGPVGGPMGGPPGGPMGGPPGGPMGGPPRSPRPPPHGQPGSGPTPPPHDRGQPPNMRPPPGGAPQPGYYGRGRGGPPTGPGYGPPGAPGPNQRMALPDRSTSLDSAMDDIIDSYASDPAAARDPRRRPPPGRGPPGPGPGPGPGPERRPPPPNQYGSGYGGPNGNPYPDGSGYDDGTGRPRPGVLKTVGGGDGPGPKRDYDIPDVNFGPTAGYGVGPRGNAPPPSPGPPPFGQPPRPYSPSGARPGTAGRNSPAPGGWRPEEPEARTMPWQPGMASAGPGGPPGSHGGPSPYGGGMGGPRPESPASFSRPLPPGGTQSPPQFDPRQMAPQGQYSTSRPSTPGQRHVAPPYQGQAF